MMAQSCYNPEAAVGIWQRMEESERAEPPQFLSTHPSHHNRQQKIREWQEYYPIAVPSLYTNTFPGSQKRVKKEKCLTVKVFWAMVCSAFSRVSLQGAILTLSQRMTSEELLASFAGSLEGTIFFFARGYYLMNFSSLGLNLFGPPSFTLIP